ncbi:hypothetical protein QF046_001817 [Microbacterium sp. W4I4]|uniref:hypothetical protein n=1 Tax=Microbacterium sp. W4I4 TaxID=3042295 RepID=UPI0027895EFE|nr:hypothetical protein [Microbacterium sp. W4I4]MDQ0614176.1 hypothetical protein [Microbacterium sp. W4I4]
MGQNLERLGRLQINRSDIFVGVFRNVQTVQRKTTAEVIDTASAGVQKAARTEGFEGSLGDAIRARLVEIHKDIQNFTEYQAKLNQAITLANEALQETAVSASGIPDAGLTSTQQNTLDMATKTESPVQVSPGVTMTPAQAAMHYQEQAELEQEEAARKLAAALDARLLEIIGGLPVSAYDERPPASEEEDGGGTSGDPTADESGTGSGVTGPGVTGPGVTGPGTNTGTGNNTGTDDGGSNQTTIRNPPGTDTIIRDPNRPELPPGYPTWYPPEGPNIDGGTGVVPTPGTGGPAPIGFPGPGVGTGPGGIGPGGIGPGGIGPGGIGPGGIGPGGVGGPRGVGGAGGGVAGGLGRGPGGVNGVGGLNGGAGAGTAGSGVAGGAGAAGSAGGTGRGGMMGGGGLAGGAGGGKGGKKNRRRGQDLTAYELEDEDDDVITDIGAAGSAGRSDSDGREDLGW